MVVRKRLKLTSAGGDYFPEAGVRPDFIPTGCTLLDCVLGGGWPLGRVENIVGDKSTGKTLLAIEACANFARTYPKGKIYYREAESAFDIAYAQRLGLPASRVDFGKQGLDTQWRTMEKVFKDMREVSTRHADTGLPGLYIVDSLDAVSSEAALKREVGEGSYNLDKQRLLAQLFEQLIQEFKAAKLCIIIVSQVRDRIGFVVGEKHRRTGGHSLDFYSTHILWLAHLKTLVRTIGGEKRSTGVLVKAKCRKNKISVPHRECTFPIRFGYGVDDVEASIDWLAEVNMIDRMGLSKRAQKKEIEDYLADLSDLTPSEYAKRAEQIRTTVIQAWGEIEARFAPTRQKYAVAAE